MTSPRLVGWFADPSSTYVDGIAATGANAVSMGPYCVMNYWDDSTVGSIAGNPAQLVSAMRRARASGLKVVLKPIIDCLNYRGDPDTSGYRAAINPADIGEWMSSYWATCFQPYLPFVDVVAVHTELATISMLYPANIVELIQEIRMAGFSGPITTSQDFDPSGAPYWSALDWIGADAYPTIRTDSVVNAVADWNALAEGGAVAHGATGCSTYFGEVCPNLGVTMSARQLSTVYQAFWEVFGPLEYWAGMGVWRWPQDGTAPAPALIAGVVSGLQPYGSYSPMVADAAVSGLIHL